MIDVGLAQSACGISSDVDWVENLAGGFLDWQFLQRLRLGLLKILEAFGSFARARRATARLAGWRGCFLWGTLLGSRLRFFIVLGRDSSLLRWR